MRFALIIIIPIASVFCLGLWQSGAFHPMLRNPDLLADSVSFLLAKGEQQDRRVTVFCNLSPLKAQAAMEQLNEQPNTLAVLNPTQPRWNPRMRIDVLDWTGDQLRIRLIELRPDVKESTLLFDDEGGYVEEPMLLVFGGCWGDEDDGDVPEYDLSDPDNDGAFGNHPKQPILPWMDQPLAWDCPDLPDVEYIPRGFTLKLLKHQGVADGFVIEPLLGEFRAHYQYWRMLRLANGFHCIELHFYGDRGWGFVCEMEMTSSALVGRGQFCSDSLKRANTSAVDLRLKRIELID